MRWLLLLVLIGCVRPQPRPTITDEPGDLDGCAAACDRMHELKCKDWKDSPEAPCDVVCRNAQAEGHSMNTECVYRSQSCLEAQTCFEDPE